MVSIRPEIVLNVERARWNIASESKNSFAGSRTSFIRTYGNDTKMNAFWLASSLLPTHQLRSIVCALSTLYCTRQPIEMFGIRVSVYTVERDLMTTCISRGRMRYRRVCEHRMEVTVE